MVPGHLVPHNWSPIDWSLWTNGPQPIRSPWTNGPQKFGPPGQMVPNQFVPCISGSPQPVPLDKRNIPFVQGDRIFGDHLSMGAELAGDHLSRGTNQLGTNCGGPNVQGPYAFGTKCVTAKIIGTECQKYYLLFQINILCKAFGAPKSLSYFYENTFSLQKLFLSYLFSRRCFIVL